jgi:hypothetical protein
MFIKMKFCAVRKLELLSTMTRGSMMQRQELIRPTLSSVISLLVTHTGRRQIFAEHFSDRFVN